MTNPEPNAEPLHVLIVDDEPSIREGASRILQRINYRVSTAENGTDALELLEKDRADVVLLDMMMPGMDGMEVLERLRERDPSILVIVITGFATLETAVDAMKRGAYDFISKPFEPEQLRIVVNRASERIRLVRETERMEADRQRTLLDLDAEKSRIKTILESLPIGMVVTNSAGNVVLMNPAFQRYFALPADRGPGDEISAYVEDDELCELIRQISKGQHIDFDDLPTAEIAVPGERVLQARSRPVVGDRSECLGAVVCFDDITAMKALDRLKSEFVAKVSHELRSPLATIHEQLAVVLGAISDMASSGDQQILSRAKEKTHGLISLIGDLLDLSRIEQGTICHDPQPVAVERLLEEIVSFLRTRAEAREHRLTFERAADDLPPLTADPLAVESIFGNLISNAITYTPEGGLIQVRIDRAGANLRVQVQDNGFGIDARHQDRIFDRFYRVKNEQTRFITGTGLGLSIVKELVVSLGGLIEVESEPGKGSTFTVLLPVGAPTPP